MGLDMWLPSIFDFNDEEQVKAILVDITSNVDRANFHPMKLMEQMYNAYRATGGYYREGYNGRGLLTRLGLSWADVVDGLEDRRTLPPDHARRLLAELEARPFTKAMIFEDRCPRRSDPDSEKMMAEIMGRTIVPPVEADHSDQEIEEACRSYVIRQQELMALLRKAIERNEPLCISS